MQLKQEKIEPKPSFKLLLFLNPNFKNLRVVNPKRPGPQLLLTSKPEPVKINIAKPEPKPEQYLERFEALIYTFLFLY